MDRERIALKQRLIDKMRSRDYDSNERTTSDERKNVKSKHDTHIERKSIRQLSRESRQVKERIKPSTPLDDEENDQVLQQSISDSPDASCSRHVNAKVDYGEIYRSKPIDNSKKLRKTKSALFDEANHPYAQPLVSKRSRPSRRGSSGSNAPIRLQPVEVKELSIRSIRQFSFLK